MVDIDIRYIVPALTSINLIILLLTDINQRLIFAGGVNKVNRLIVVNNVPITVNNLVNKVNMVDKITIGLIKLIIY